MMRTSVPRAFMRPMARGTPSNASRPTASIARFYMNASSRPSAQVVKPLALTTYRNNTALIRSYADAAPGTSRNPSKEAKFGSSTLPIDTAGVTTTSSVNPVLGAGPSQEEDIDMMAGIRHDVKIIKETFALNEVPKEAYNIGLAGVIPYLATSTATVVCAFELHGASENGGVGFLMNEKTAELFLHVLEPLQVGYGAVIISFLGAIHWGLEWAGFGGRHGYSRYAYGVIAPAIAWPTVLMPVEYALITQFLAFNVLYAADASASVKGWVPAWYQQYRFILTFVVGASIVLSLIGRGQIQDRIGKLPSTAQRIRELREGVSEEEVLGKEGEEEE